MWVCIYYCIDDKLLSISYCIDDKCHFVPFYSWKTSCPFGQAQHINEPLQGDLLHQKETSDREEAPENILLHWWPPRLCQYIQVPASVSWPVTHSNLFSPRELNPNLLHDSQTSRTLFTKGTFFCLSLHVILLSKVEWVSLQQLLPQPEPHSKDFYSGLTTLSIRHTLVFE